MHRSVSRILFLTFAVVLVSAGTPARAQYISGYNAHRFLGASSVYHIRRDRAGFLWFCTNHGLIKYDGHITRRFSRRDGLPDDTVFDMYEDRQGRIWPFCFNGKYCFISGDSVHNEANDPMLAGLPNAGFYITYMAEDSISGMYIGFISRRVLHIYKGKATWDTLGSRSAGLLVTEDKITASDKPGAGIMVRAGNGIILTSDASGLRMFRNGKQMWAWQHKALTDRTVSDMCLTSGGRLAVGTSYGLVLADTASKTLTSMLNGMRVTGCVTDIAGNLWVSTAANGVFRLHRELGGISQLPGADGCEWVPVNDSRLVFTRNDTLYEFLAKGNSVIVNPVTIHVASYDDPVLVTDRVVAFYDNWSKYSRVMLRNGKLLFRSRNLFKRMYVFNDTNFLSVSKTQVCLYRLKADRFEAVTQLINYPERITAACQDPVSRKVYFISGAQLYTFDFTTRTLQLLYKAPALAGAGSMSICDAVLCITGGGYRYWLLNLSRPYQLQAYVADVMVDGFIPLSGRRQILLSDAGNYITTNESAAGKQGLCYPFAAAACERMALCGSNCLVRVDDKYYYFDTGLLNKYIARPNIYMQRFTVNGKTYATGEADIRHADKADIQIGIGVLDFGGSMPDIDYRITGPDGVGGWTRTRASEIAILLRKAGDYRIEVRPAGMTGISKSLTIRLVLHQLFFRSATFFILCGIAAVLAIAFAVVLVLRFRRRQFTRELNYLKLEHRAINALLNPHFVFNAINNIQNLIHRSEKQDATDYLATLSHLIRQNLENLKCHLIPLEDELKLIRRYIQLQDLRFGNISLHIDGPVDDLLRVQVLPLMVHTFVENAIVHGYRKYQQPFLIRISVQWHGKKYLKIVVEDNGIGVYAARNNPAHHTGSSMGIAFSRKRLDRLSDFYGLEQSVTVEDLSETGGQGTRVTIICYALLKTLLDQRHVSV